MYGASLPKKMLQKKIIHFGIHCVKSALAVYLVVR
jgi:hypothetical protein